MFTPARTPNHLSETAASVAVDAPKSQSRLSRAKPMAAMMLKNSLSLGCLVEWRRVWHVPFQTSRHRKLRNQLPSKPLSILHPGSSEAADFNRVRLRGTEVAKRRHDQKSVPAEANLQSKLLSRGSAARSPTHHIGPGVRCSRN